MESVRGDHNHDHHNNSDYDIQDTELYLGNFYVYPGLCILYFQANVTRIPCAKIG